MSDISNKNFLRYVIYDFTTKTVYSHHSYLELAHIALKIYRNTYNDTKNFVIFDAVSNKILGS